MEQYVFSDPEREFFGARVAALNAQQIALRDSVSLVISQQKLAGTWRIADDGAGLVRVDAPPAEAPEPPVDLAVIWNR